MRPRRRRPTWRRHRKRSTHERGGRPAVAAAAHAAATCAGACSLAAAGPARHRYRRRRLGRALHALAGCRNRAAGPGLAGQFARRAAGGRRSGDHAGTGQCRPAARARPAGLGRGRSAAGRRHPGRCHRQRYGGRLASGMAGARRARGHRQQARPRFAAGPFAGHRPGAGPRPRTLWRQRHRRSRLAGAVEPARPGGRRRSHPRGGGRAVRLAGVAAGGL